LEESIGLDVELSNPSLQDLYNLACSVISRAASALSSSIIGTLSDIRLPTRADTPVLEYSDAIDALNASGLKIPFGQDLGVYGEARLGWLIKKKHDSDIVIVQHYPDTVKKFYTLRNEQGLTETFDVVLRGWEVVSGALRETNVRSMKRRMILSGLVPAEYEFYISIVKGAPPHGGFGMGFDRVVGKLMGFDRIEDAVPFPRAFEKLIP
jgi:aspartyl/asparaginyl-tRNA synthetase